MSLAYEFPFSLSLPAIHARIDKQVPPRWEHNKCFMVEGSTPSTNVPLITNATQEFPDGSIDAETFTLYFRQRPRSRFLFLSLDQVFNVESWPLIGNPFSSNAKYLSRTQE